MRVKEKMSYLELSKMKMDEITDLLTIPQLVNNTNNTALRKKALRDGLNLKTFLDHARAFERADQQSKEIEEATSGKSEVNDVNAIHECRPNQRTGQYRGRKHSQDRGRRSQTPSRAQGQRSREKQNSEKTYYRCGGSFPHTAKCPAINAECNHCHKTGHYSQVCLTKKRPVKVQAVTAHANPPQDGYLLIACVTAASSPPDHVYATIQIAGEEVRCVIDTGAQANVLSGQTYITINAPLLPNDKKLCAYGPEKSRVTLLVLGKVEGIYKSPTTQKTTHAEYHVVRGTVSNILGRITSEKVGLVSFPAADVYSIKATPAAIGKLIEEY